MSRFIWRRLGDYGAPLGIPPTVFLLLTANLAVFLLSYVASFFHLYEWFSFIPDRAIDKLQIWRFVSYMFLHGNLWHLLFNMIGLWLFGSRMEHFWGTRTFAWYYFICGIGGAVLHGLFSPNPVIGASAAVLGLLLAFGLAFPRVLIFLFGIIPVPAFIAVILFALMSVFSIGPAYVAHLAHLGGMVAGFLFLWIFTGGRFSSIPRLPYAKGAHGGYRSVRGIGDPYLRDRGRGPLMTRLYQQFMRWRTRLRLTVVDGQHRPRKNGHARHGGTSTDNSRTNGYGKERKQDLDRVDEILEKISRQGLKSLTPDEQDILRRASKHD